MAGHEWEDWFEREEFIGQISDIRVQNLQVEREVVQKRTFTRWMNLHLEKCDPPVEVHDLFRDIQDGRILMALLEELSGCKLLHGFKKSSHRIFRLNNIAKVLSFLEERNVKLISIDAADVADGNASIVLGLIWNIILFFQIKELTGNIKSQFPSSSSLSSIPTSSDSDTSHSSTPSEERRPLSVAIRDHGKPIKKLLQWVQKRTRKYGVAVQDFGKSWTSGLAFLAVIKSIDPSLVDMRRALLRSARENLEDAFRTAHYSLGIPRLLEPEDVTINPPDEQSIMIYVSQFLEHFPGIEEPEEPSQVIERSVSMGRLSSRDHDSDQMRNGLHRSRLRERPYTARKDWVPKIFISSVSEDRGIVSPTSPPAGTRSWASEDFLAGSTPGEDRSTGVGGDPQDSGREAFTISNANSPELSYVRSAIGSSVTESVTVDSAIGSPDSWVESEVGMTPGRFGESRSDSSLCDSGTAWDASVPPTTPEEALKPSLVGKPPGEQSVPELFIDEGICSLSSMESTQERIEEASQYNLGRNQDRASKHVPGQKEAEKKAERGSERMDTSPLQKGGESVAQRPSLELSNGTEKAISGGVHSLEPTETKQSQPSSNPKPLTPDLGEEDSTQMVSECAKEAVEHSRDSQDHEGQLYVETESVGERNTSAEAEAVTACQRKDSFSEKEREETGFLKEGIKEAAENSKTQHEASQGTLNDHTDPQGNTSSQIHNVIDKTDPGHSADIEQPPAYQDGTLKTSLNRSMDLSGTQNSMPNDTTEQGKERTSGPEEEGQAKDEDLGLIGSSESQEEEMAKPKVSEQKQTENGHDTLASSNIDISGSEAIDYMEITETREKCVSPHDDLSYYDISATDHIKVDSDQPSGHQDEPGASISVDKTATTQQNRSNSVKSRTNSEKETTGYKPTNKPTDLDSFCTDNDRSSPLEDVVAEPLDPMDLFYPDKAESVFTEPAARETESQPSVFSVSALQPAPASETLPGTLALQETRAGGLIETHRPREPGEDFRNGVDLATKEQEKEITETHHGVDTPSEPQDRSSSPGEEMAGDRPENQEGPSEPSDLTQTLDHNPSSARENTDPMRSEAETSKGPDESLTPTILHQSTDNQTKASTIKTNGDNSVLGRESSLLDRELYLLLLLWLLLYCLWLLPQIDLCTLPSLLLNLDH
ncbi:uncharacterized protein clmna [Polymixia lowei]